MLTCTLILVLLLSSSLGGDAPPEVRVKQGQLRGTFLTTKGGRQIRAFLGIPFAKPPLGSLRFEPPVPGDSWEGVRNATGIHAVCPQRDIYRRSSLIEGEEDCLYLNVYAPTLSKSVGDDPLPVMIFFHGGGFLCGGGNSLWYGPDILLDRDIVLVVTNYRLGALGFLSTGDEVVPGNNGMKDQNLAIRWTKENIAQFGGDPEKITLFGESAGGASVELHMVSPLSKGLFHRGISQSGSAHCSWAVAPGDQAVKNGRKLAKLLDCPTINSKKMVECLKHVESYKFIEQDVNFMEWDTDPMIPFKVVIEPNHEGAFLLQYPNDVKKSGKMASVPWMVGLNANDGALRSAGLIGNPHLLDEYNEDFNKIAPIGLISDQIYHGTPTEFEPMFSEIKQFYFGNKKMNENTKDAITDMYTDGWFLHGIDESIRINLKHLKQPIYYYLFGHRGSASFTAIFGDPKNDYGVCHADELQYLFPITEGLFNKKFTDADKKVSEMMTALWTNFAKTGNPTPETSELLSEKWLPVQSEDEMDYCFIDSTGLKMKKGLYSERVKFWRRLPTNSRKNEIKDEL